VANVDSTTYDPLSRRTAADYDTGEFFRYSYDNVGSRQTAAGTVAQSKPSISVPYPRFADEFVSRT
jgi:hypothetical protein